MSISQHIVPTSSVELLMVINITSSAALLSWLPPSVGDQNGIIVNFGVNVTTVPTGETVQHFTGNTELQLESLRPHTDYRVVTAAYTEVGKGPYSTILPFQTLEDGKSFCLLFCYFLLNFSAYEVCDLLNFDTYSSICSTSKCVCIRCGFSHCLHFMGSSIV